MIVGRTALLIRDRFHSHREFNNPATFTSLHVLGIVVCCGAQSYCVERGRSTGFLSAAVRGTSGVRTRTRYTGASTQSSWRIQALEDLGARGCCRPWCISFPTCFPLTPCFQISIGINRMRLLGIIVCNGTGFFCVGLGRSTALLYTATLEPAAFAPGGGTGGRPNHATGLRVSHRTPYTLHHVTCVYIGALIPIGLRNPYRVVVRSQGGAAYMHRKCLSHHRRQRTCLSHHPPVPTRTKQKAANAAKQVAAHLLRFALQCEREDPLEPRPAMAAHPHAANLLSFRERCQRDVAPDPHPRMRPCPMNMARRAAVSAIAEAVNDVRVGVLTTP